MSTPHARAFELLQQYAGDIEFGDFEHAEAITAEVRVAFERANLDGAPPTIGVEFEGD